MTHLDPHADAMRAYYGRGEEQARLEQGHGLLEFERTIEILSRHLPRRSHAGRSVSTARCVCGVFATTLGLSALSSRASVPATLPPIKLDGFTAVTHRPDDLAAEVTDAGLSLTDLLAVAARDDPQPAAAQP